MTELEKIVKEGLLKDGEEIYLEYRKYIFTARIVNGGKFIENEFGKFEALSRIGGILIASVDNGSNKRHSSSTLKQEVANCNGWTYWKNWNGVSLNEFRKRLEK